MERLEMSRTSIVALVGCCIGLGACASASALELFSKTGPVIAIMADELFLGEAVGHLSGAGTIAIHSQRNPGITCLGKFTSSAELGGSGQMRCSNGATGTYRFTRLTMEKGHGQGRYNQRPMSFTYGLTADESRPYLKLPAGKKLDHGGKTLALVEASPPSRKASRTAR